MTKYNKIDYSNPKHWLSLPDSINKQADVFYLYPTAWVKYNVSEPDICEIDNPSLLEGTQITFKAQASVFENTCNIFSPYYRQAAIECLLGTTEKIREVFLRAPLPDATGAFEYYIKHLNNGRPFILAGHSQGSALLLSILARYMKENPDVYGRMIAAYIIGCPVTKPFLSKFAHLKFAEGADDTGVIISYNTEAPEVEGRNITWLPESLAINPITWTREETYAPKEMNFGSIIIDKQWNILESNVKNYADARVDRKRGVVVCRSVNPEDLYFGNPLFPKGVYHSFDYPFYYYNLRENAEIRIKSYISKQKNPD